jgi:hypothetical protein
MSSSIKTYKDLLQEEQRLLQHIKDQEALIKQDIVGIKEGLIPFNHVARLIRNIVTRDKTGPLVNLGLDFGIDLLFRRILLAKAGWFARIVIPYFIKNFASHVISEERRSRLVKKVQELFNKIRPKPDQAEPAAAM